MVVKLSDKQLLKSTRQIFRTLLLLKLGSRFRNEEEV